MNSKYSLDVIGPVTVIDDGGGCDADSFHDIELVVDLFRQWLIDQREMRMRQQQVNARRRAMKIVPKSEGNEP